MTKTITALALATGAALLPLSASASTLHRGGHINGWEVDVIMESDSRDVPDTLVVYGPRGKEEIKVTCRGFDWESWGPNTHEWVDSVAAHWCF